MIDLYLPIYWLSLTYYKRLITDSFTNEYILLK